MAKKVNEEMENELGVTDGAGEEEKSGKVVTILIVLAIVLIWLGVFGVLIKLDVGSFGSSVLYPALKDVPVINKVLPDVQSDGTSGNYDFKTVGDAVARIKELEKQLATSNDSGTANSDQVKSLQAEVARLKKFEDDQNAFSKRVEEFDNKVVFNEKAPALEEYKTFYEGIDSDNAQKIYKKVVEKLEHSQKIKDQADIYSKMDPAIAATKLETMTGDLDLLASIFDCMQPAKSALILQNMSAEAASQITKKMTQQ